MRERAGGEAKAAHRIAEAREAKRRPRLHGIGELVLGAGGELTVTARQLDAQRSEIAAQRSREGGEGVEASGFTARTITTVSESHGSSDDEVRGCIHEIGLELRGLSFERRQRIVNPPERGAVASLGRRVGRLGDEDRPEDHQRGWHFSYLCRLRRSGTARRNPEKGTDSRRRRRRTSPRVAAWRADPPAR